MNLDEITRRKALKLAGVAGVIGVGPGVAAAHKDDVDPQKLNELREQQQSIMTWIRPWQTDSFFLRTSVSLRATRT